MGKNPAAIIKIENNKMTSCVNFCREREQQFLATFGQFGVEGGQVEASEVVPRDGRGLQ